MKFPYKLRDTQRQIIKDIENVLKNHFHMVFESPTGSGKTIATLYPVVKHALTHDKKVFYLVHTNSQEKQVMKESKKLGILAVALQGRVNLCTLAKEKQELKTGAPEDLALLCSKLKKDVLNGNNEACIYYSNYLERGETLVNYVREGHTAEEVFNKAMEMELCAYEAIKDAIPDATVIVFPYIYFFNPFIRRSILDKLGISLQDIILIIDEAHNLPDFARELKSMELTVKSLDGMEKEAIEFGNPQIMGHSIADIGEFLKESMYKMDRFLQEEEGLIPHYAFEEELSKFLGIGINDVEELAKNLIYYGEMVREEKIKKRKLPKSHIYHVGSFLYLWNNTYSYEYLRLIRWDKNPALEIYCLDPTLVTDSVKSVYSSIHLSGTLELEEYKNIIGLPENTVLKRYPWTYPKENLKIYYVEDVTTKYEEVDKYIDKYAEYLDRIIDIGRNTVIFFPSYTLLSKISNRMNSEFWVETRGMRTYTLFEIIEKFKKEGGTILSVIGGRFFEGLDFPGKQLEIVVIVGIPYPKPTPKVKALEMYYESKFGNGWDYAFRTPAITKIRQAIGRLIRSEEDRGIGIVLDRRAVTFKRELPLEKSQNLTQDIKSFFKE